MEMRNTRYNYASALDSSEEPTFAAAPSVGQLAAPISGWWLDTRRNVDSTAVFSAAKLTLIEFGSFT